MLGLNGMQAAYAGADQYPDPVLIFFIELYAGIGIGEPTVPGMKGEWPR